MVALARILPSSADGFANDKVVARRGRLQERIELFERRHDLAALVPGVCIS